jgi:sarcosine oxidase
VAVRQGAELRFNERIVSIQKDRADGLLAVTTSAGTYYTERLVMTCGAWSDRLGLDLRLPLTPERRIMHWFAPKSPIEEFAPPRFPIWIWEHVDGAEVYGFPALDGPEGGVKFAFHNRQGSACDPDSVARNVTFEEIQEAETHLTKHLPGLAGRHLYSVTCIYTCTPDHHFVIGLHPDDQRIVIGAGFSGHGFKFASAIGEALAELAIDGRSRLDISLFQPDRSF